MRKNNRNPDQTNKAFYLLSVSLPNQVKPDTPVPGSPKPETPTSQTSLSINSTQPKSQSDSELELAKKAVEDSITTTEVAEKKDKIISEPEVC